MCKNCHICFNTENIYIYIYRDCLHYNYASLFHATAHLQRLSGSAKDFDLKELKVGTCIERHELIVLLDGIDMDSSIEHPHM